MALDLVGWLENHGAGCGTSQAGVIDSGTVDSTVLLNHDTTIIIIRLSYIFCNS